MDRLQKCIILKERGYKYDKETGKIYGSRGFEIKTKNKDGYTIIRRPKLYTGQLLAYHFAWFMTYGNVDFDMLDHINQIRHDNRIDNLRSITKQQNNFNTKSKGFYFNKEKNKYVAQISLNYKKIYLGQFDNEEDAKQAYLLAKNTYHII